MLVVGAYCRPQGCDAGESAASQHIRAGVGPCQGARSPQVRDAQCSSCSSIHFVHVAWLGLVTTVLCGSTSSLMVTQAAKLSNTDARKVSECMVEF